MNDEDVKTLRLAEATGHHFGVVAGEPGNRRLVRAGDCLADVAGCLHDGSLTGPRVYQRGEGAWFFLELPGMQS